jgi:hypothetical protein
VEIDQWNPPHSFSANVIFLWPMQRARVQVEITQENRPHVTSVNSTGTTIVDTERLSRVLQATWDFSLVIRELGLQSKQ